MYNKIWAFFSSDFRYLMVVIVILIAAVLVLSYMLTRELIWGPADFIRPEGTLDVDGNVGTVDLSTLPDADIDIVGIPLVIEGDKPKRSE